MNIYSPLSQQKEHFTTLVPKKVQLYVCGITPYDTTHLGHAFLYIFFDVFKRYLEYKKYEVNYTQNVTDIDDDILKRAKRDNVSWQELGDMWTNKFVNDLEALNIQLPTNYIKATDSMPEILEIVDKLVLLKHAYIKNDNVYFDVTTFPKYGVLSRLSEKEMIELSSERGADPLDKNKRNPLDFILWQKSRSNEPFWESPYGNGRPGWHIECSAMAYKTLGTQIDVHGGGFDLIYPHHESEIAQSECFSGKSPFAAYWMHAGMLSYRGEKMSKSLGNLVLVSNLLKKYSPQAVRWVLLSHHYREPWEYFDEEIDSAQKEVDRVFNNLQVVQYDKNLKDITSEFAMLMEDDLNTPGVLKLVSQYSTNPACSATIRHILDILGFKMQS